jgi:hypothetical protein
MKQFSHTVEPSGAILLFSRNAAEEAAVKTFDSKSGRSANRAIAQRLIRHATATARKSGLPVFTCFSTDQAGHQFGERLANAIEAVYARGFSKVIAIGNDCPALSSGMLCDAAIRLETEDMVMGPAADGGVYLLGLDRAAYQRERFLSLPWQSGELQTAWQAYAAEEATSVYWLDTCRDIDHQADFFAFLKQNHLKNSLVRDLHSIVATGLHSDIPYTPQFAVQNRISGPSLRAPPH